MLRIPWASLKSMECFMAQGLASSLAPGTCPAYPGLEHWRNWQIAHSDQNHVYCIHLYTIHICDALHTCCFHLLPRLLHSMPNVITDVAPGWSKPRAQLGESNLLPVKSTQRMHSCFDMPCICMLYLSNSIYILSFLVNVRTLNLFVCLIYPRVCDPSINTCFLANLKLIDRSNGIIAEIAEHGMNWKGRPGWNAKLCNSLIHFVLAVF